MIHPAIAGAAGFLLLCVAGVVAMLALQRPRGAAAGPVARTPAPGERGRLLTELHQAIVVDHDSRALEAAIGQAGSRLADNPLYRAMQAGKDPAAPKPPGSA